MLLEFNMTGIEYENLATIHVSLDCLSFIAVLAYFNKALIIPLLIYRHLPRPLASSKS